MIIYIILFIILLILLLKLFIKIKYPFWSIQPVFHYYNIQYWFSDPKIIQKKLPLKNKYYDYCINFEKELNEDQKNWIFDLIKHHYLRNKITNYIPTKKSIFEYFEKHEKPCYFSLSFHNNKLTSTMTTRPLTIYKKNEEISIYYVDYLCVHNDYRKKGHAPNIIYTHYINSRYRTKNLIFLFKREGKQNKIVPLASYLTYGFSLKYWKKIRLEHPMIKMHQIIKDNIEILHHYLKTMKEKFKCFILPCISNIINLIEKKLLYVFIVMKKYKPFACYFFRNPLTYYNKKNSIDLIASVCTDDNKQDLFIKYFYDALFKIDYNPKNILIENLSYNNIILKHILKKRSPFLVSETAYFFYNYASRPYLSKDIFLLN